MIFVTVGTHEQQFNRLIEAVDQLKKNEFIKEDVVMQTGFSSYEPQHCQWSRLIPYEEMQHRIESASIVITHGGPASFLAPLQIGKIPIVVPRQKQYGEHVNDHQLAFCRSVEERMGNIIVVEDVEKLGDVIDRYWELDNVKQKGKIHSGSRAFSEKVEKLVDEMMGYGVDL